MRRIYLDTALIVFILLSLLTKASDAYALCIGTAIRNINTMPTYMGSAGGYSVFDGAAYGQSLSFEVFNTASVLECEYFITLDAGLSGNVSQRQMGRGGNRLNYNVYTSAARTNILHSSGARGGSNVINGKIGTLVGLLSAQTHQLHWTIDPLQIVGAGGGIFEDNGVTLRVWEYGLLGVSNSYSVSLRFQAAIESDVDLSLVNSGGAFNIFDTTQIVDFGDLGSGSMMEYDTIIRSNDGYSVTLQSQNGQVLRHDSYPSVTDLINYNVQFGGTAIDLSGGSAVIAAQGGGVTSSAGARFPTRFTIGAMSGAELAGNYQDVITVTVSAH